MKKLCMRWDYRAFLATICPQGLPTDEHPSALSAAVHPLARGNGAEKHRLPARTTATAIRLWLALRGSARRGSDRPPDGHSLPRRSSKLDPNGWTEHIKYLSRTSLAECRVYLKITHSQSGLKAAQTPFPRPHEKRQIARRFQSACV